MKILVTGNTGYIGPILGRQLRKNINNLTLIGYDTGFLLIALLLHMSVQKQSMRFNILGKK